MTNVNTSTPGFLESIVPDEGVKFVTEWKPIPKHPNGGVMIHYPANSHADMAAKSLEINSRGRNAYFAMATYKEVIWKEKNDFKYPAGRSQDNALWVQSLWQDWDVGKAAEANSYATLADAKKALLQYNNAVRLPAPTVTSSGYGLHTYWPLSEPVSAAEWETIASLQRIIMRHEGIKFDPSRDKDCASVLRPIGTNNYKEGKEPAPVRLIKQGATPIPVQEYKRRFLKYITDNGLELQPMKSTLAAKPVFAAGDSGNLVGVANNDYPPSDANRVADNCKQIAHFRDTGCIESEPLWYDCLGLVKHCQEGEKVVHEWSAKAASYDEAQTQGKINQWDFPPTTCVQFKSINPAGCAGCTHTCKSPIQLGVDATVQNVEWLPAMNERYAWIDKEAGVYRIRHRDFIPPEKFNAAHANQTRTIISGNGTKEVAVSRLWLANKGRRQHAAIVTRPAEPAVTADNCLNDWSGYVVEPVEGNVAPFEKLYSYLFGDDRYALLWLAHLIQFPGGKLFVALVVWSLREGVGKNLLFEVVGSLFSRHHFALIGQSEVDDDFCGWIPGTVFVLADEVRASKSEKARDRLKLWTTGTTLRTHDKGQPKREVENLMNAVFLSNHADGMFLSDHDRRFYVHEVKAGALPESLKQEFLAWRDNGGKAHLLHYLQRIDLDGFDPKARAPVTESKREMIEAGRSDLDRWALDVVSGSLPIGKEVATAEELAKRFWAEYPQMRTPPNVSTVGKVLVRLGAYRRDNQVRLGNGRKVRALALLRVDHWKDQPEASWREELEKRS